MVYVYELRMDGLDGVFRNDLPGIVEIICVINNIASQHWWCQRVGRGLALQQMPNARHKSIINSAMVILAINSSTVVILMV